MDQWQARLRIDPGQIRLRVSSKEARDPSLHRQAQLRLLERVGLFESKQLPTASIAASDCRNLREPDLFGDERWAYPEFCVNALTKSLDGQPIFKVYSKLVESAIPITDRA